MYAGISIQSNNSFYYYLYRNSRVHPLLTCWILLTDVVPIKTFNAWKIIPFSDLSFHFKTKLIYCKIVWFAWCPIHVTPWCSISPSPQIWVWDLSSCKSSNYCSLWRRHNFQKIICLFIWNWSKLTLKLKSIDDSTDTFQLSLFYPFIVAIEVGNHPWNIVFRIISFVAFVFVRFPSFITF